MFCLCHESSCRRLILNLGLVSTLTPACVGTNNAKSEPQQLISRNSKGEFRQPRAGWIALIPTCNKQGLPRCTCFRALRSFRLVKSLGGELFFNTEPFSNYSKLWMIRMRSRFSSSEQVCFIFSSIKTSSSR